MRIWLLLLVGCSSGGTLAPSGPTQVVAGDYTLYGITRSGLLVVRDQNHQISTVPLTGGKPTAIGTGRSATVRDDVVFLFDNFDSARQSGSLSVWTAANGLKSLAPAAQYFAPYVFPGGEWLLYFDNLSADGKLGDMISARVDGTGRQVLETQIPIYDCYPYADSLGTAWLLSYCLSWDNQTFTGVANLERFDPVKNERKVLLPNLPNAPLFSLDAEHSRAFTVDADGNGLVYDAGGLPTTIAANATYGLYASDGALLYVTGDNQLVRHQGANDTPLATLMPKSFFSELLEISPDGKTALFSLDFAQMGPFGVDLWSISATQPSSPKALIEATTAQPGIVYGTGSSFTKDSAYVMYASPETDTLVAPLHVVPAGGGTDTVLGDNFISMRQTHDSHLIFCDNNDQATRTCDLVSVDAARPAQKTTLASHVIDYATYLSNDGKTLAWAVKDAATPAKSGVWLMATP